MERVFNLSYSVLSIQKLLIKFVRKKNFYVRNVAKGTIYKIQLIEKKLLPITNAQAVISMSYETKIMKSGQLNGSCIL